MRSTALVCALAASVAASGCQTQAPGPAPAGSPAAATTTAAEVASRTPGPAAAYITIRPDGTSAIVRGTLEADKDAEYVVSEEKGALLLVQVVGEGQDPAFSVHRADTGADLPDDHPKNVAHWIERVPETLGYLIVVHKTGKPTPFALGVESPRELIFDAKTNAAQVELALPANATVAYVVPPSESINAELTSAPKDAYLTAEGVDSGKQLLKAEAAARRFTGAAVTPGGEVVLRVHQGKEAGDVALRVERR